VKVGEGKDAFCFVVARKQRQAIIFPISQFGNQPKKDKQDKQKQQNNDSGRIDKQKQHDCISRKKETIAIEQIFVK
jgi:hypothetical protein